MEALEIRLSEEIMSEMDDACPLDSDSGGPNPEKRGPATTPFMSVNGRLHYLEWVRPIAVRWKEKACEVEKLEGA
jgi:hypothetical protein